MLTIVEAQWPAENAEVNTKNMPIMGESFTYVDGVLCQPQRQGTSKSLCSHFILVPKVNYMCNMAYLCAISSSVYLLACYYEMLHSTWKHIALVSETYIAGFSLNMLYLLKCKTRFYP